MGNDQETVAKKEGWLSEKDAEKVVKDNAQVAHDMKKQNEEDDKAKAEAARENAQEQSDLREITDETYHKMMVKKRAAKKAAIAKKKLQAKLAKLAKDKRTKYLAKLDCNHLRMIFDKAQPEYANLFNQACK